MDKKSDKQEKPKEEHSAIVTASIEEVSNHPIALGVEDDKDSKE